MNDMINRQLQHRTIREFKDTSIENGYRVFDSYLGEIRDYDKEMTNYYDLRDANRRVDSFSDQVVSKLTASIPKRREILKIIRQQGFGADDQ